MHRRMLALVLILAMLVGGGIPALVEEASSPEMLREAQWIWSADTENNVFVDFVKTFTLSAVPENALAAIGVENSYWLYVNGQEVVFDGGLKRGPSPTEGYYDLVDLTPYLAAGENRICIRAWFWGVKGEEAESYSNVPVDTAGLIFAMQAGDEMIVSDGSWKAQRATAFLDDTALGVPQPNYRFPEYNVYYSAALENHTDWLDAAYDSSAWPDAQVRGAYGDAPWNTLAERPIPLLRVSAEQVYEGAAAYADYTTQTDEDITLWLPYNAQVTPGLTVEADREAVITITTENTVSAQSVYTSYVTAPDGLQSFESPAWISGMQVTYHIPAGITVKQLYYRESGYDTDIAGTFSMGDDFYDTLWQMGARTQMVCIRENFMDCPDRERAQWTGDAASQMRQMMYCLTPSTYPLYTKMLSQKVAWITPGSGKGKLDNLIPTVAPIYNEFYELPAQEMAGIISVWDYYLYTGDQTAIETIYQPALLYLQRWKLASSGLVKHKTGQGLVDWQDTGSVVDTKVCENAWYYWCLTTMEKMAALLGEDTTWLTETAEKVAAGYETLWVDGVGYTTTTEPDDRGNALAVLSGLAPEERYPVIAQVLRENFRASSYMEVYPLRALCEMGCTADALERMRTRFGEMVSVNLEKGYTTLWEYFTEGQGTWNHAWSASPVYILSAYVGGVRPTSPGYDTCVIQPDFSHCDTVSVTVCTVKGLIQVEGTATALNITLPEGVSAQVILPDGTAAIISGAGTHLVTP